MIHLRPQRIYKPSALSYLGNTSDIVDSLIDRYSNKDLYRLRIETPRGTSITKDNSQITCYAHIFDREDGTELTDLLKGRGYRPTWLLDGKPIDSTRISEEGYQITLETDHLPAIYQTVTLQVRDTDILLALTTDENQKRIYSQIIELGSIPTHLIKTSEKLLNVSRLDKIRVEGLKEVREDLSKGISANNAALEELHKNPLTVDKDGYWRIWDIKQHQYVTTEYQSRGDKGEPGATGAKGDKGDKPVITLNDKYQLLADGVLLSQQSLKGAKGDRGATGATGAKGADGKDGHTPNINWDGTKLIIDDLQAVDLRGQRGETGAKGDKGDKGDKPVITLNDKYQLLADGVLLSRQSLKGAKGDRGATGATGAKGADGKDGHTPSPDEVLDNPSFRQLLGGKVSEQITPVKQDFGQRFDDLNNRSLTADQRDDVAYLTNSLQVLRSAGNTLEGLALQRIIALSGDNQTVSAYLASNAMPAVLKAGITDFGTPQEREQVEITHQGSGHFGNLYFAGDTIDFRTSQYTDPYLSIGAEEATFIETFLKQARLDDTPVTVSSINLTPTSTGYQRTITADNDGTRLTITLDKLNIATFDNTFTRLTLDGDTLAEWRGTMDFREKYRNGILVLEPVRTPYEATGLTYERVVRAGTHTLRLQIINPQAPYTATVNGLKVRRRYDTGAQQSALTKSGLRLFGSPDRYFDVDYRQRYTPRGGQYTVVNPYLVRIKGGAKIDKLTVDKIEGAGSKLSPIVTPQLGLGGQTTLYPKYDEWVLTSDTREQQVSFGGLTAEIGKSIYIQTRKRAYLLANGHSFFGLASVSENQWLSNNTTYRFVRAGATDWLVTASSSPYPWT